MRIILILTVVAALFLGLFIMGPKKIPTPEIQNETTSPATTTIPQIDYSDEIIVTYPKEGDFISSPLVVTGRARGNWFFEANLPLVLENELMEVIANGHAEAEGEWMTEEFVNFKGMIIFSAPSNTNGFLVVKKDNPTGEARFDKEIRISIKFK